MLGYWPPPRPPQTAPGGQTRRGKGWGGQYDSVVTGRLSRRHAMGLFAQAQRQGEATSACSAAMGLHNFSSPLTATGVAQLGARAQMSWSLLHHAQAPFSARAAGHTGSAKCARPWPTAHCTDDSCVRGHQHPPPASGCPTWPSPACRVKCTHRQGLDVSKIQRHSRFQRLETAIPPPCTRHPSSRVPGHVGARLGMHMHV
jgi:hypothetical protein